jgi:hypothetical protein
MDFYSDYELEQLDKQYQKEYAFLYKADRNRQYVAGYDEALDEGIRLMEDRNELMIEFARWRGDALTSDRELAAFAFAAAELEMI